MTDSNTEIAALREALRSAETRHAEDSEHIRRLEQDIQEVRLQAQHSMRNILSVVRSIARRSVASARSIEEYQQYIDGRIGAFARVQSAISRRPGRGVDLGSLVADELVEKAGVHAMLHRQFVAPLMDGDTIIGIVTESKAGREAILADRVVDATGDADVATRAGAPVHRTAVEDMMAASVMFHLAGVDKAAFLKGVAEDPQTYRDWAAGEFAADRRSASRPPKMSSCGKAAATRERPPRPISPS